MKNTFPFAALLVCGLLYFASCNKGDDNPYGDWRCTCFVTSIDSVITPTDTILVPQLDTVFLTANDMDRTTALSFCEQAKKGYTDTVGGSAACKLK